MSLAGVDELVMSIKNARQNQVLVAEKLQQWEWMIRFIESNPDVKLRWDQYKTYEILKHE